ncbi:hypothetical protein HMPREF1979_00627 [Actinomyces johnsonii F0542]|uniref:Uncharacterized protein n=1 Tax=Actinomyces johnsonii F0542 TaxID=1321818 RepID=U1S3R7_9ACTO|nr:hypothetical protein HMPREF1979_00627 [Actinomyces johnsonii F0542]
MPLRTERPWGERAAWRTVGQRGRGRRGRRGSWMTHEVSIGAGVHFAGLPFRPEPLGPPPSRYGYCHFRLSSSCYRGREAMSQSDAPDRPRHRRSAHQFGAKLALDARH